MMKLPRIMNGRRRPMYLAYLRHSKRKAVSWQKKIKRETAVS